MHEIEHHILTSDDTTPGTAASIAKAVETRIWSFMMMMIEFCLKLLDVVMILGWDL